MAVTFENDTYSQFLITCYRPDDAAGGTSGNLWLKVSGADDPSDKVIILCDVPCYIEGDVVAYAAEADDISCKLSDWSMKDDGDDIVVTMRLKRRAHGAEVNG